jgi:hypothetical protein
MEAHWVARRRGSHTFLENRLTDDGEIVSLTRPQAFTPQEDSWYSETSINRQGRDRDRDG